MKKLPLVLVSGTVGVVSTMLIFGLVIGIGVGSGQHQLSLFENILSGYAKIFEVSPFPVGFILSFIVLALIFYFIIEAVISIYKKVN
jgi:hypothetical protein